MICEPTREECTDGTPCRQCPKRELAAYRRALSRLAYEPTGCLVYMGSLDRGYGKMNDGLRTYRVHRLVYETVVGEVPAGLDLDHLCRNRACANPAHLEPVTRKVNLNRGAGAGGALWRDGAAA